MTRNEPTSPASSPPASPRDDKFALRARRRSELQRKFKASLTSLITVTVSFWVYWFAVVPFIEPSLVRDPAPDLARRGDDTEPFNDQLRKTLLTWFSPDDWPVKQAAKILQTPQGILVLQDYSPRPDGSVRITPCVLVYLPQGDKVPASQQRDAFILRAPAALLRFDNPLDLRTGSVGKPVGGQLQGQVNIISAGKDPGPEDDLSIETQNLDLTDNRITSEHEVLFRYGRHHGQGERLQMTLLGDAGTFKGLHTLELKENVTLNVWLNERKPLPAERGRLAGYTGSPIPTSAEPGQVVIRARGQFRRPAFQFDFTRPQATFRHNVNVFWETASDPDQLTCEELTLRFKQKNDAKSRKESGSNTRMEFRELVAKGFPVKVYSPSRNAHAECDILTWNESTRWLGLQRDHQGLPPEQLRPVLIEQDQQLMRSVEINVQISEDGQLNRVRSPGPGSLVAQQKNRTLSARWSRLLTYEPDQGELRKVALTGDAELTSAASGRLTAEVVKAWLMPEPEPGAKPAARPRSPRPAPKGMAMKLHRAEAYSRDAKKPVIIRSVPLTGQLERLELTFEHAPPAAAPNSAPPTRAGGKLARPQPPPRPSPRSGGSGPPEPPTRRFDIRARTLVAGIRMAGSQAQLTAADAEGNVRILETAGTRESETPLSLSGERLRVRAPTPETGMARVQGSPARVEGRDMGLQGGEIELDRGKNTLWVNGPGALRLPVHRQDEQNRAKLTQPLVVNWQGGMYFDGLTARFEKQIRADFDQHALQTDRLLEVQMDQRFNFAHPPRDGERRPGAEHVRCYGSFVLHGQTAEQGTLLSLERMEARDLRLHYPTGQIQAAGPGWLEQVRRGSGPQMAAAAPMPRRPAKDGLNFIRVKFHRDLEGNFRQQRMLFTGNVETVYGPVENWDQRLAADRLGPSGIWMKCNEMEVRRMGTAPSEWLELEAQGNIDIDGQQFTARGSKLTYTQQKDLLVLQGDGHSDARISKQGGTGLTGNFVARKILFWRSTGRVKWEDGRPAELNVPQSGRNPRPDRRQ